MCYECHICGISLSDNKEFMCYECHICGISLSDNEEFMCYECHICGISQSDNKDLFFGGLEGYQIILSVFAVIFPVLSSSQGL